MGLVGGKYLELSALEGLLAGGAGSNFVRLLFERAPAAIAVFDRDMRYLAASQRWYQDYGLGDAQIIGRSHYDVFPDVPDRWKHEHARCLAGETLLCEADHFVRSDGTSVWIKWELVPLKGAAALPVGMIMLTEVITRQIEAEAAREASEKTLEIAEEVAHIGTWDWDLRTEWVVCSPVMRQLLGIGEEASPIRIDDLAGVLHPEDAEDVRFGISEVRSGQEPKPEIITRVIRPDGTTIWLRLSIRAGRDANGRIQQVYGTIQDITDERLAHEELAFRDRAFETAASPLTMSTIDACYTYGNQAFVELLGYDSFDQIVGRPFRDFITDPGAVEGSVDALRTTGRWSGELRMVRADGSEFDVAVLGGLVRDEAGEPLRVVVSYLDVTERNMALAELSRRESQLRQAQVLARLGPWRYDMVRELYVMPPETRSILGLGEEYSTYSAEFAARQVHPDDVGRVAAVFQRLRRGEADNARLQYRYLPPAGGQIHLQVMLENERDAAGKVIGLTGLLQDITDFHQLEQAHRETERAMSALMSNLSGMVYRCDNDERWTMRFISDACSRVLGYDPGELVDNRVISYDEVIDERDRQRVHDTIQDAVDGRRAFQLSYRVTTKQGELRWVLEQGSAIRDDQDRVVALEGYVADITAEQHVVEQLQESEARNRAIMDSASVALITANEHGVVESFNPEAERLFGYAADEIVGANVSLLLPLDQSNLHDGFLSRYRDGGGGGFIGLGPRELVGRRKSGEEFPIDLAINALQLGGHNLLIASARDLTERKRAEARLAQAQKMETVGQLVGGVAHDFNNLLMAMQLNLELANMLVADRPEASDSITVALNAVGRGAELTRRLLAFSRQQPLEPQVIDANELVGSMMKLLHRLLQENIEARTVLDPKVWPIEVDPGQLEAALLNLVVNARDAMPDGGRLGIETANVMLDPGDGDHQDDVTPGEHVRITVSDSGIGMTAEVLARAFDPFFTTKEVGKGSGLGLSMVYGFVKQSGGHVAIDSRPGEGTRVMLHFRRAHAAPVPSAPRQPARETVRPGHETILLVEDDADVRRTVERLLKSLGYQVVTAPDGPAAVELIVGGLHPDLLLADVVLPKGMSGKDVSLAVAARVHDCRILFMSGYTEDAVISQGRLEEGVVLLSKPFPRELLASKVRELLDG
ncbi:MAG: PAS domain S-box protein [Sphingomonadales bacterium]